eukprot:gene2965-3233_t
MIGFIWQYMAIWVKVLKGIAAKSTKKKAMLSIVIFSLLFLLSLSNVEAFQFCIASSSSHRQAPNNHNNQRALDSINTRPFHPSLLNIQRRSFSTFSHSSDEQENQSDIYSFLKEAFNSLSKGKPTINFNTVLRWSEIQALLADGLLTEDQLRDLYLSVSKSSEGGITINQFIELNESIDELVGYDDDDSEGGYDDDDEEEEMEGELEDLPEDFDVWDPTIDATTLFEETYVSYLTDFFSSNAQGEGSEEKRLSLKSFIAWQDVQQLLDGGNIDESMLKELWVEAVQYQSSNEEPEISSGKRNPKRVKAEDRQISLDTFLRMNFRLEETIEDIEKAIEDLTDEDMEKYYRVEFDKLADRNGLLTFARLLKWDFMQEMLEKKEFSMDRLTELWTVLPKQPVKPVKTASGFSTVPPPPPVEGIDFNTFVVLNNELDRVNSQGDEEEDEEEEEEE